jgi:hypothetical protein
MTVVFSGANFGFKIWTAFFTILLFPLPEFLIILQKCFPVRNISGF